MIVATILWPIVAWRLARASMDNVAANIERGFPDHGWPPDSTKFELLYQAKLEAAAGVVIFVTLGYGVILAALYACSAITKKR